MSDWVVLVGVVVYSLWAWRKGHVQPVLRMVWFEVRHPVKFARMARDTFRPQLPPATRRAVK